MTIHHATIAKAEKLGVVMSETENAFRGHWTERNKRGFAPLGAGNAAALLEDMKTWQMLAREYSHLKVEQPHVDAGNFVWEISLRGDVIAEGARLADAFEEALDVLSSTEGEETDEDETDAEAGEASDEGDTEGDEDTGEGRSVVKRVYKTRYRPFKMTCGDELSQLITAHITVKTEEGNRIDQDKLRKFAKQNGVWMDDYKHLNVGMQRMNVANRLRAIIRKNPDHEIVWN